MKIGKNTKPQIALASNEHRTAPLTTRGRPKRGTVGAVSAKAGILACSIAALLALPLTSSAITWVGNTSVNWGTPSNWGGTLPTLAGDTFVFGAAGTAGTGLNNNITNQTINSLTINAGAPAWTLGGNSVTLAGDVTNNSTSLLTLSFPIATTAVRTFTTGTGGGDLLASGIISGTGGGVVANGSGTLTLTAANTYTGQTTINAGSALQLGSGGTAGSILSTSGVTDNGTLVFNRSGNPTSIGFAISGSGALTLTGTGTITLTATNSYTGQTTINSGSTLQLGFGAGGGNLGNISTTNGVVVNNGTLVFNRSTTGVGFASVISGSGAVNFTGSGSIIFSTAHTYTGQTTINAGSTLQLGSGGTAGSILSTSGVTDNGTLVFNRSGNPTAIGFVISGSGALSLTGAGTITLASANTYSGLTTISAGTLQLGFGTGGGTVGAIDSTSGIANNATLAFNRSNALSIAANITGSGIVNQIGAGTTTLSGTNSYGGGTNVSTGGLTFLNTNAKPGTGTTTVAAGATLALGVASSGSFFTSTDVDNLFAGTLANVSNDAASLVGVDTTAGNFTYATSVSSTTRGLNKLGVNTLSLPSANSYTGTTAVSGGVLRLDNANALPGGVATGTGTSALLFNGGVLGLTTSTGDFTRTLGSAAPAATEVGWASVATGGFAAFGGNRTVNFGGAATPTLVTWSSTSGSLGAGLILSDSSADSTVTVVNPIALNSGIRTVTVNDGTPAVDGILSGVLSGTASSLIKNGAGTLALTGTNTFGSALLPGTTFVTISAGTLQIGTGGTAGSLTSTGTGDIQNNATLAFNRSNALTVANNITGSGEVRQIGGGTTTLSGSNTYTGPTTVTAGTLEISGSINGSSAISLTNGGLLLSASNAINDSAPVSLANATLSTGGNSEFVGASSANATAAGLGALTLLSTATIDFGAGSSTLWLSGISALTGTLNLANWSGDPALGGGTDQLRFTSDPSAFLSQISFGGGTGAREISFANGGNSYFEIVPVPEPSSTALLGMSALWALGGFRSRNRQSPATSALRAAAGCSRGADAAP